MLIAVGTANSGPSTGRNQAVLRYYYHFQTEGGVGTTLHIVYIMAFGSKFFAIFCAVQNAKLQAYKFISFPPK
jgi:hypothetical protein